MSGARALKRPSAGSVTSAQGENSRTCDQARTALPADGPASRTQRIEAALEEVGGGGQVDRASSDDYDGQLVGGRGSAEIRPKGIAGCPRATD